MTNSLKHIREMIAARKALGLKNQPKPPKKHRCNNCGTLRTRTELLKSKAHDRYLCKEGCSNG